QRVDAVDGWWLNIGLEAEEAIAIDGAADDAGRGADSAVIDGARRLAVESVNTGFGLHIVEALDVDFASDDGEGFDDVVAFGHDGLPGLWHDAGVGAEDAAVG